ncbi:MAG: nickel-responsive transcriptional regulator NikR [Thermoplasmata archaeon]|nr:nickel-responsive transcriptional regulator NikR [Thermoplasmata archaeon]
MPGQNPRKRGVVRFAISFDAQLAEEFERWVRQRNSPSRSDAIRFLVRRELAEKAPGSDPDADTVGTVLLLYRHRDANVLRRLASAQHRWGDHVRSSTHVHLPGDACAEIILLLGKRREIERAAEDLRGVKGVREGRFVLASPGVAGGRSGHHHPHHS